MLTNSLFSVRDFFLDLLFPRECAYCGSDKNYLCKECAFGIPLLNTQSCPACGKPNVYGYSCCASSNLDQLLVAVDYHKSQNIPSLIHLFKYRFSQDLAQSLAIPLIKTFQRFINFQTLIVPVPLHPKRMKYRGFNQSELLAMQISQTTRQAYGETLKRIKYTSAQAELGRLQRHKNMLNAFQISYEDFFYKSPPYHVTLIDDVYTTGSTLNECARTLKNAGVKYVTGLTIARSFLGNSLKSYM